MLLLMMEHLLMHRLIHQLIHQLKSELNHDNDERVHFIYLRKKDIG